MNDYISSMIDKIILWLIKQLIRLWDRHDDATLYTFSGGEHKEYAVIVENFYDNYYTIGTEMFPVNKAQKEAPVMDYPQVTGIKLTAINPKEDEA